NTKARRNFGTLAAGCLSHCLESGAAKRMGGNDIEIKCRDGKRCDHRLFLAGRDNAFFPIASERARRHRRSSNGALHGEALGLQALTNLAEHLVLTAKKMGDAGDVQEKAIGRIQTYRRRKAIAPVSDARKELQ